MGVGRRLKEHNPDVKIIAVVPNLGDDIMGLRSVDDGFVPPILDISLLSGRMVVGTRESFTAAKKLIHREGIFAGVSSGAVMHCAVRIASKMKKGNVVALLADSGWKYLSSQLWTTDVIESGDDLNKKLWW
jgi:cysteine synthase B